MAKIAYTDKSQAGAYDATKFNAQDANEIKTSVNALYPASASYGTGELTFDQPLKIITHTQAAALTLSLGASGNAEGYQIILKITGDNTNSITIPTTWVNVNGEAYNNTKVNTFFLQYIDGLVYYSLIKSEVPTGPDVTAPTFITDFPSVTSITETGLNINVQLNEAGTAYYVVVADGATAPSSAEVKAGTSAGGAVALASGSISITAASTTASASVPGLTGSTSYDIYVVAEDDESTPNLQASPVLVNASTTAGSGADVLDGSWANLVNVTATGNTIQKTGGANSQLSDAGASSLNGIAGDFELVFALPADPGWVIGVSTSDPDVDFSTIQYNFFRTEQAIEYRIFESGSKKQDVTLSAGTDTLRIRKSGSTIFYEESDNAGSTWSLIASTTSAPSGAYYVDCNIVSLNTSITITRFSSI